MVRPGTGDLATMDRQRINEFRARRFATAEFIAFICECEDENCRRSVRLRPEEFRSQREYGDGILFAGHMPVADAPMAADHAAEQENEASNRDSTPRR